MAVIGVDVGGTKTLVVRLNDEFRVESRELYATPRTDVSGLTTALSEYVRYSLDDDIACVGVCLPGMVDDGSGTLVYAPQPPLRLAPIGPLLADLLNVPVALSNDANAATWAEYLFGAARGHGTVLGVIVGTGVGCGVVIDGRLLRGAHGLAAEVGMMTVGVESFGRLRRIGSGFAIAERGRQAFSELGSESALARRGIDPASLTGEILMDLAQTGDLTAQGAFARVGQDLGSAVGTLINIFDPSVVVIGGGAADSGDLLLEPIRRSAALHTYAVEERPPVAIVAAELGNAAGAIGAAHLSRCPAKR